MQQKISPQPMEASELDPWSSWVRSPGGQYLMAWEQAQLDLAVGDVFGFYAVQLGFGELDALQANRIANRVLALRPGEALDAQALAGTPDVTVTAGLGCRSMDQSVGSSDAPQAAPSDSAAIRSVLRLTAFEELPFAENSVDLLVLPHVLERSVDAHQVLREVARVLRPEGRVIVTGINPISLWGARDMVCAPFSNSLLPGQRHWISMHRLRDWLGLLSFEPDRARYGCYRLPARSQRTLDRLAILERLGDRWWPICGSVYLLSAVKRVRSMRLVGPAWKSDATRSRAVAVAGSPRFQRPAADSVIALPDTDSRGSRATGNQQASREPASPPAAGKY